MLQSTPTEIPTATRGTPFTLEVFFTYSDELGAGTVTSVDAVLNSTGDEVTIVNDSFAFMASGRYISGWQDVFTYTDAGTSDKTAPVQTAVNIANMPRGKNLFNLAQDTAPTVTKTYVVTVDYVDANDNPGQEVVIITQEVNNDLEAIRYFMDNYNYNGIGD